MKASLLALAVFTGCQSPPAPLAAPPAADTSVNASSPTRGGVAAIPRVAGEDAEADQSPGHRAEERAEAGVPALAPLTGDAPLVPLEVAGARTAIVAVPVGATSPRPVVLALHGNFDRPEWQCDVWRAITRGYAFVLCPRGTGRPDAPPPLDRWTYGAATEVRREIDAAMAALRARYRGYVDEGDVLYAGFSLGAILGVGIVSRDGARFPRAVLIEGGHSGWSRERAQAYAALGGKRVLFACGQPGCRSDAAAPAKLLLAAGVASRVVYGGNVGHAYDGSVARIVEEALPWLTAGDPRWSGL